MAATYAEPGVTSPDNGELARIRARLLRPLPADRLWGWLLPLAVTAVGALLRFWHLGTPKGVVFDEVYYEHDAWSLLHHGVELDKNSHDQTAGFIVHPPIGKWMIAVGEAIFGHNAVGWRFSAAVVGSLAILMVARIGRRLFRSTFLGCVAGLLLAFDGLEFVQSRTAMLDIFLMFWVLAAFGCLVIDRDDGRRRLAERLDGPIGAGFGPWLGVRPWRIACAVCLGLAMATKWDGVFWLPVFLVLMLFWDAGARRVGGADHPFGGALVLDELATGALFVVVPLVVYTVSWTGWFASDGVHAYDHDYYVRAGQSWLAHDWAVFRGWVKYHHEMYDFHSGLDSAHPYLSRPMGWMLLIRPVAYYYASPHGCGAADCSQEVLGVGTPALWYAAILAFVFTMWRWVARRDWRAAALALTFLAGYVPWFYEDAAHHRTMFLFYLLPAVPFMALMVAMTLGSALGEAWQETRRIVASIAVGAYLILVIANFAWLRPVLAGDVITYNQWHHRMMFTTCDPAKHRNEHHENAPCWI